MATEDWMSLAEPDAEWAGFVKQMGGMLDLGNFEDIPSMREFFNGMKAQMTAALGPPNPNVHEEDKLVKVRDGAEIRVRIFTPKKAPAGGSPLAYIIHGGGFCVGEPENETVLCRRLSDELGFVCVNVDYRLAPEHPFPVPVNDCFDVLQWTASHASELKADPSKGFIVGGTSAGGNLAAVMAHLADDEKLSPPLTGALLIIPVVLTPNSVPEKFKSEFRSYEQNSNAEILGKKAMDLFMKNYNADESSTLAAPFNRKNQEGMPPTYFMVCGMDPLRDEALLYERELRQTFGVKTKLSVYPGVPHSFWSMGPHLDISKRFSDDTVSAVQWLQSFVKT